MATRQSEWKTLVTVWEMMEWRSACSAWSGSSVETAALRPEAAMLGDCRDVTGAVQNANNDYLIRPRLVIDGIGTVKGDAQTGGKPVSRGGRMRKVPHRLERGLDVPDKARGDIFGHLSREPRPNFG